MDEFAAPSFILASLEDALSDASASSTSSTAAEPFGPSSSSPLVDQEYIDGNGSYSWCTIA
ncbi:hypothetical protein C2E23DRAFT_810809 [Lenzites betulinus]|nr:hypothetical protein C2E23DRAFT_810809 [Lenzites betulinus]